MEQTIWSTHFFPSWPLFALSGFFDLRVEEEWSPGEIVVDRCAINTFGSRSEPRHAGSTTLIPSLGRALALMDLWVRWWTIGL